MDAAMKKVTMRDIGRAAGVKTLPEKEPNLTERKSAMLSVPCIRSMLTMGYAIIGFLR